jgi:ABC-type sulfate transport system permease component
VVVVLERQVSRRLAATTSARSRRPLHVPLHAWRWPSFAAVVLFIGNALLAPVLALGWWAWRGLAHADDAGSQLGDDLADLVAPAANTAIVSIVAAATAVAVVLPLAYLTTRYRSRPGGVANAFVVAGFALPGISVALAMVFWSINAPILDRLYQTVPLLIFAYVIHFGAQSMRASQVAVGAMPMRLDDAARGALIAHLLPRATLITPNLAEAAWLSGREVNSEGDARDAAKAIAGLGANAVLVTGGHLAGDPVDTLYADGAFETFVAPRAPRELHGLGCALSAAITAQLARGATLREALARARAWLLRAIASAPSLGAGRGPIDYFA